MFGFITCALSDYSRFVFLGIFLTAVAVSTPLAEAQPPPQAPQCRPAQLVRVPELPEGSGIAVSRRTPGRLWAHNDSGRPVIVALDSSGKVTGQIEITGAEVGDWEAIAVGRCGSASCLHIADIGDNRQRRERITIYRLPEPANTDRSAVVADVFHATYPDGAHDAETFLIDGDSRMYIVTKGEDGPIALYRFPEELRSGAVHRLERVGVLAGARPRAAGRVTDGAVSPDGQWVVLRTNAGLTFYRASDLLAGQWREASRVDLTGLKEPQGEGIALGDGNVVFVAGEGGGGGRPGTFARFPCAPKAAG